MRVGMQTGQQLLSCVAEQEIRAHEEDEQSCSGEDEDQQEVGLVGADFEDFGVDFVAHA